MKINIFYSILIIVFAYGCSHINNSTKEDNGFKDEYYQRAFYELDSMLEGKIPLNFKRAVFISENAYLKDSLSYISYQSHIDSIVRKIRWLIKAKRIEIFKTSGQYAVYSWMCEPSVINDSNTCKYDFDDFMGYEKWTNMFVTKLINSKKGNCHSLPFLYKILTDELGVEAYLSMAPSHVYIMHKDEEGKWVNIELTNGGGFSSDAWIISSMGITTKAIRSGIYMAPLPLKESVALCLYDLAMGYKQKYGHSDVVEMMCDKVLQHYPNCIMALMLKSDCLYKKRNEILSTKNISVIQLTSIENKYKVVNKLMTELGYTDMSPELYNKWARSVEEEMKKIEFNREVKK